MARRHHKMRLVLFDPVLNAGRVLYGTCCIFFTGRCTLRTFHFAFSECESCRACEIQKPRKLGKYAFDKLYIYICKQLNEGCQYNELCLFTDFIILKSVTHGTTSRLEGRRVLSASGPRKSIMERLFVKLIFLKLHSLNDIQPKKS